jgi:sigma-E factor negative regulatory protein RseA
MENKMMQDTVKNRELVSALTDGQLQAEEFARTVDWLGRDEDARLTWHAYHVVGDVLRSGETLTRTGDAVFMKRFTQALQQELPITSNELARGLVVGNEMPEPAGKLQNLQKKSSNDSNFRWQWLAGIASLAAVLSVGWQTSIIGLDHRETVQLSQGQPVMIRDPQLDALLAAHRQLGGGSALQVPAGFLRNATFEGVAR